MSEVQKTATMAVDQYGERVIKISFPYDLTTIDNVRSLPGRKWHPEIKCWSAPIYLESLNMLISWGFSLDDKLHTFILKVNAKRNEFAAGQISGLKGKLYPFQGEGVAFIDHNRGRALIADEMGLGKTVQALGYIQLHPELRPVIIVCPASLKLNWERECHRWLSSPDTIILKGTTPYTFKENIIIINYDILPDWFAVLRGRDPQILITDECHYYKSNKAKRTKAVKMLSKGIPNVIALSGTPIENRPIEIYNAISIIKPDLFPKQWHFIQEYCNPRYNGFGWDFNGASNTTKLHDVLTTTIMIRRKKADVLKDLPDKVRSFIPMELTNVDEYYKAESNFINWVRETKGKEAAKKASNAEAFACIETLKQLAVKGKLKQAKEWIRDFLESDRKLVVFATHHFVIDELTKEFGDISVHVDGRVPMNIRQQAVDLFQTKNEVKLFIGNIEAAGVGLTLTAASDVAFLQLPWTPGKLEQATDRVHRIGQKNSVNVYYLLANNSIEERIAKLLDNKRKILDGVLDGKDTDQESLLTELMKQYE